MIGALTNATLPGEDDELDRARERLSGASERVRGEGRSFWEQFRRFAKWGSTTTVPEAIGQAAAPVGDLFLKAVYAVLGLVLITLGIIVLMGQEKKVMRRVSEDA